MRRVSIELNDEDAEWLEARIDDSKPTLESVVKGFLGEASRAKQQDLGVRPCTCGTLDKLSAELNSPIVFDATVNEFELLRDTPHGKAKHVVQYCFWCGGKAPASKRAQLFATVEFTEIERLHRLCTGIRTFNDAIARFGPPEFDRSPGAGISRPTSEGAEEHTAHRVISYASLSHTANVRFTQRSDDIVSVSFVGKYIGPPPV